MAFIARQTELLKLLDTIYLGIIETYYIPKLKEMAMSYRVSEKYKSNADFKRTIDGALRTQLQLENAKFRTNESPHFAEHEKIFLEITEKLTKVTDYEIYVLSVMDHILRDEMTISKTRIKTISNNCRECSWPQDCWTIILDTTNRQADSPFKDCAKLELAYTTIFQAGMALCKKEDKDFLAQFEGYINAIDFSLQHEDLGRLPDSQKEPVTNFLKEVRGLLTPADAKASTSSPGDKMRWVSMIFKKTPPPQIPNPSPQGFSLLM